MKKKIQIITAALIFLAMGPLVLLLKNKGNSPNVLLISLDALRPDHLGCYGYAKNTSPNIDRLAKEGVIFTNVVSQTNWTNGSLAALFTSTYPSTNKIENFGDVLDKRLPTLAEILKKKQYSTACTSGGDWIYKDFPGIRRGFDHIFEDENSQMVSELAISWIKKNKGKKFFVWLHFFDYPHAPYLPPAPYGKLFPPNQPPRHIPIIKSVSCKECIPDFVAVKNITDVEYYISQYDGEIAYADAQIGKILDELKRLNLYENTLIIILSDHGESLGEHGYYFQHGLYLYDQLLKIPLIMKGPMIPGGRKISRQVQEIDIMPTVLDYAKIRLNKKMEGSDLKPLISNKTGNENNNSYAFSEIMGDGCLKSIRTPVWKLIYNFTDNNYELYNLSIDPKEINNLAGKEPEQFKILKGNLDKWMSRKRPDIVSLNKPLDRQSKEKLHSLGYLQ